MLGRQESKVKRASFQNSQVSAVFLAEKPVKTVAPKLTRKRLIGHKTNSFLLTNEFPRKGSFFVKSRFFTMSQTTTDRLNHLVQDKQQQKQQGKQEGL
jgi:hypothetical protein